jgi:hypothetical protein
MCSRRGRSRDDGRAADLLSRTAVADVVLFFVFVRFVFVAMGLLKRLLFHRRDAEWAEKTFSWALEKKLRIGWKEKHASSVLILA